jgi:hypothetical protein
VHLSISANSQKETQAGGEYAFRFAHDFKPSLVSKHFTSTKPKKKPVKDSYWKKDSASYQESPKALCKTSEDVGKPGKATK